MTDQELIQALRCTSATGGPVGDCKKCPFLRTEHIGADWAKILGQDYWEACDVNAVAIAAANRIANQNTHILALQREIEGLRSQNEQLRQLCRGYDLGRLVNLAEADKAGRVVVRPYSIGETVYVLLKDGAIFYPETNGWYISEEIIEAISHDGFYLGNPVDDVYTPDSEIGKTVFLTREEAKAALEAMKDE